MQGAGQGDLRGEMVDVLQGRNGIETDNPHLSRDPAVGHPKADLAQTQDAQGFPGQLESLEG